MKDWTLANWKWDYLILVPILALAFYIAFIPHMDYPYPVHIDEWNNFSFIKAILHAQSTTYTHPYLERMMNTSSNIDLETSFRVFWVVFYDISGISWLTIFRYFPGVIFMITVLSVYTFARREGFGWEAALFTCLIPTSVGILGPAFLVAVAMGLLFIPLSLFIAFNFRTWWSYLALFIFTSFLLAIHATTAVGLVIILIPYILLNLKGNFKHGLWLALALAVPFLAPFPWIFSMLLPTAQRLLVPQYYPEYQDLPRMLKAYGYLPSALCLLGTFLLAIKGGKKEYGLILGLLAILVMLVTYFTLHYGLLTLYERGLMYMMLMIGIVAGAGLMGVRKLRLPERINRLVIPPLFTQNVGRVLCLALIGVTLAIAIPNRLDTPYYHMINDREYEDFSWIRDNVSQDYSKAILDPWKATPFYAITEKRIFSRIHAYPKPSDEEARKFLSDNCTDTTFLRENGISIVYTPLNCDNPDLVEVKPRIYLLKKSISP